MPVPDLGAVIDALRGTDTYLVLDNTCLSVSCQPFALAGESVRLVVFESLLKYAQLGLDRANAGVIVARREDAESLEDYREHLGTNIPDMSVHALPPPDRGVLERRLARLQRNAMHLADGLDARVPSGVAIVYPGLDGHRRPAPPHGSVPRRVPLGGVRRTRAATSSVSAAGPRGGGRGGASRGAGCSPDRASVSTRRGST